MDYKISDEGVDEVGEIIQSTYASMSGAGGSYWGCGWCWISGIGRFGSTCGEAHTDDRCMY